MKDRCVFGCPRRSTGDSAEEPSYLWMYAPGPEPALGNRARGTLCLHDGPDDR
jgi:hypothetical protein